jgi:hypothetical protein
MMFVFVVKSKIYYKQKHQNISQSPLGKEIFYCFYEHLNTVSAKRAIQKPFSQAFTP